MLKSQVKEIIELNFAALNDLVAFFIKHLFIVSNVRNPDSIKLGDEFFQ